MGLGLKMISWLEKHFFVAKKFMNIFYKQIIKLKGPCILHQD